MIDDTLNDEYDYFPDESFPSAFALEAFERVVNV